MKISSSRSADLHCWYKMTHNRKWQLLAAIIFNSAISSCLALQSLGETTGAETTLAPTDSPELLLSPDQFVDYTEAPTILFDSLQEQDNINNHTHTPSNIANTTTTITASGNGTEESSPTVEEEPADEPQAPFVAPQNVSQYMDYIERLFHDLRHQITDLFEPHLPQLIRTSQMVQLSSACSLDMLKMALALRQFEPWALRMIDSSGKLPEGIFEGSFTALGSYDECLNTVFAGGQTGPTPATQGKYCLVNVSPFLPPKPPADKVERMFQEEANRRNYSTENQFSRLSPMFYYMKFRIGVCMPSSCVDQDMDSISSALSSSLRLNITIPHCRIKQLQPITKQQLIGGLIFGLVFVFVLASTLIDYSAITLRQKAQTLTGTIFKPEDRKMKSTNLLTSLSILTNFNLYFRPPKSRSSGSNDQPVALTSSGPDSIRCLNGIRVLSLCWVIVANSYITLDPRATKILSKSREAPRDFLFQLIVQASLAIETFFFLSGLLMSLSFARSFSRFTGKQIADGRSKQRTWLAWLQLYLHRYIRMTPATMLVIAFTMFAFRYGDGPLWFEATNKAHQSCSENWWRHLLHVANFIDTRQMCFIHYWYIAADMQLFLLAPPLLYLLNKRPRIGQLLASLLGLASVVFVFYTTYTRNLPPTLLFYNSDPESRRDFGNSVMTKPLTHILPYIVGMLLGRWLVSTNQLKSQQDIVAPQSASNKRFSLTTLIGSLAVLVGLAEVFLPYKWNNSHLPTRFLAALYAALFRLAWSLVLAYLVVSCRHQRNEKCTDETSGRCKSCQPSRSEVDRWTKVGRPSFCIEERVMCLCSRGGSLLNRFLSMRVFAHLSRLSFVAYLIHLPLMSVFVAQTRGLFAFSHMLVVHLALSYLVMTFALSFLLVHVIEFPFITFERFLFEKLWMASKQGTDEHGQQNTERDEDQESSAVQKGKVLTAMSSLDRPATLSDKHETFKISIRL